MNSPLSCGNPNPRTFPLVTVVQLKNPNIGKSAVAVPAETVESEKVTVARQNARRKKPPTLPRLKVSGSQISVDHADPSLGCALLRQAMGTTSDDFARGLIGQLVNIGSEGQVPDESGTNFALAMVGGVAPRDQVEAMLAAQMAAVHMATMTFARRLANVDNIVQQDSAEKAFNKLARTFAAQVEALKRYRSKGEQRVIVERVNVEKGGQAIVGNVAHRGGVEQENER